MEYIEDFMKLLVQVFGKVLLNDILCNCRNSLEIIHKSENYILVNKPYDLLINSNNPNEKATLEYRLSNLFPGLVNPKLKNRFYFIHRLDYAVSGLILIALNKKACGEASSCFEKRTVEKYYLALLRGHVADNMIDITQPVGQDKTELDASHRMCVGGSECCILPKDAHTKLLVLERGVYKKYPATKVLMKLITGRRHQLRVHCSYLGHTIVGDYTYSHRKDITPFRTCLHSFRLKIPSKIEHLDFQTNDPFSVEAMKGDWIPVELVNSLDTNAFVKMKS